MRVGEHLRFGTTAKLSISAPRPSSAPFGGTFPEGKVWGAFRPPVCTNPQLPTCGRGKPLPYVTTKNRALFAVEKGEACASPLLTIAFRT